MCARFIYAVACCLLEGKGQPGITWAAAFLQTRSLSWGPKPALDQQVRVFLPKILVKERTGAELRQELSPAPALLEAGSRPGARFCGC